MKEKIIRKIAVVIANTVLMLNSEMVILGGDSEIFTEENIVEIKKILEKVCPFVPEVVTSKLGADAQDRGRESSHCKAKRKH